MIKEYRDIKCDFCEEDDDPIISPEFSAWLRNTWKKYKVNLVVAADAYIEEFMNNQALWPPGTRKKTGYTIPGLEYVYDDTKANNRFGINRYFSLYGDRPFLRGKKRHLELLMIHSWEGKREMYQKFLEDNPDL